jgi:hypothetical protein
MTRTFRRRMVVAGVAAATFCLASMASNAALAQSFSIEFGSGGTTSRYYNGYGGTYYNGYSYVPRSYGYTGYGQGAYGYRSYGYGSTGLYVYPSSGYYGTGSSHRSYYRGLAPQGGVYSPSYHSHGSRHYSPYGYGGRHRGYGYGWRY